MSDFEEGMAVGLAIGRKKFSGGDTPTVEKWTYPAEWLPLPEVGVNEVAALVFVRAGGNVSVDVEGDDPESVDWGDPNGEEAEVIYRHRYSYERGTPVTDNISMFVLKAHYSQGGGFRDLYLSNTAYGFFAAVAVDGSAIKTGSRCILYNQTSYLQYIKITGDIANFENRHNFIYNLSTLKRVDFENPPTKLPNSTFTNCYCLRGVDMPDLSRVTSIGNACFQNCWSITDVDLPLAVSAGNACFMACYSLKTVNMPMLKSAGDSFLRGCSGIVSIELPMLESIGSAALDYCYSLETVDMEALTAITNNNIGSQCYSLRKVNMPNIDLSQSNIFPSSLMVK